MPTDQRNTTEIRVGMTVNVPAIITAIGGVDGNSLTLSTIYPSTIGGTTGSVLSLNSKQVIQVGVAT